MQFHRSFQVKAPIERVVSFHRSANSLKAITPPFLFMSAIQAPAELSEGDEMAFTLWMGPLPVRWEARVENFTPVGFDDIQTRGPYQRWMHEHRFEALAPNLTRIDDQIEYQLHRHGFWRIISFLMSLGLPVLFWYRALRTKALLERSR